MSGGNVLFPWGLLNKVLYGEAPPGGSKWYQNGTPFIYTQTKIAPLSYTSRLSQNPVFCRSYSVA